MLNDISRALTCLLVSAALTACAGDDTGNTDTETTVPSTSTSETDATTMTSTEGTTTDPTDGTSTTDPTDGTSTTDPTDGTSTTDPTDGTSTTDPTDGTSTTDPTDGTSTTDPTDGTSTSTSTSEGDMGFEADVYPIISASCSCHLGGPKAGLHMPDAATAYANLVDVDASQAGLKRVATGMPGESYIINKIEGTHGDVGGSGNPMPPGGPLSADKIMTFKDWIADGAMP